MNGMNGIIPRTTFHAYNPITFSIPPSPITGTSLHPPRPQGTEPCCREGGEWLHAARYRMADEIKTPNKTSVMSIENRILSIREQQVMLDRDLAELYGVETKRLNEAVKRNIERFPERFRFQLTDEEMTELVANCDRFTNLKHSSSRSYVFTEQGIAMLSSVLRSETAVNVSIRIMDAFVAMRRFLSANAGMFQRIERLERHQTLTDQKVETVLRRMDEMSPSVTPEQESQPQSIPDTPSNSSWI